LVEVVLVRIAAITGKKVATGGVSSEAFERASF